MDLEDLNDLSEELIRATGQMFMIGFGGKEITPQVVELITKYHVGAVILSVKNMENAESTQKLILELQKIAHDAGHEHPLLIAIDQENGMLNNLHDEKYLSQFPGPMAMVATKSVQMAKEVAEATAKELKSLGINWIFGPVLDVLTNSANRLLGVRTMGDDPQEVTKYGLAYMEGYTDAGLVTCGKHFPGYGNATVDSTLGLPIVPESIEQLETASLIPFREAVRRNIDAIMVGGCALPKIAMNEMHACLSERVVNELLRENMGFEGVIVSECLEMDALYENVGIRQGTVMAALAGCDMILVCSSHRLQKEALSGLFGAVRTGIIDQSTIYMAAARISGVKKRRLNWAETLAPLSLDFLRELKMSHLGLSRSAYEHSITLLRDHARYIPLSRSVEPDGDIALLTPLVTPIISTKYQPGMDNLLLGEGVFQEFGRCLAKLYPGKILHASYTANGLMNMHEAIIERAQAVIVVTTDANRNMYQVGFTRHVNMICSQQRRPLIAIAASSPYDLALDRTIGTYLCLYEFTYEALETTAKILFGLLPAKGTFPGSGLYQSGQREKRSLKNKNSKNPKRNLKWLVEKFQSDRDLKRLKVLWEHCFLDRRLGPGLDGFKMFRSLENGADNTTSMTAGQSQVLDDNQDDAEQSRSGSSNDYDPYKQTHFVIRNSSTSQLYGFCATWVYPETNVGCIVAICVDPSRRGMSIGTSLHDRAMKYLVQERRVSTVKIGTSIPSFFQGIPLTTSQTSLGLWFQQVGWSIDVKQMRTIANRVFHGSRGMSGGSDTKNEDLSPLSDTGSTGNIIGGSGGNSGGGVNAGGVSGGGSVGNVNSNTGNTGPSTLNALSTMILSSLQSWTPQRKLISEVEMIGIKFDICLEHERMEEVRNILVSNYGHIDGLKHIYDAAFNGGDAKIIIALDPVKNSVVGALILFTRGSNIAGYMPWILEFEDARVGGLTGLITDPLYKDLTNVFTLGLVGCGLRQFKLQGFERCVIDGITEYQAAMYIENGFTIWRRYVQVVNPASNFV